MPPAFDFQQQHRLDSLKFVSNSAGTAQFSTDDGIQLSVQAHAPGVYRLRLGQPARTDYGLLARDEAMGEFASEPIAQGYRLTQGEDSLEILSNPLRFNVLRKGKFICGSVAPEAHHYHCALFGRNSADQHHNWSLQMYLELGQALYGLTESAAPHTANYKQLSSQPSSAEPIINPLLWSMAGWGVLVNTLSCVWADTGATSADELHIAVSDDSCLDVFIFIGDSNEVLNQYAQLAGRQATPPLWALGTWLRSAQTSPETLVSAAKKLRDSKISADVIMVENGLHWHHAPKGTLDWNGAEFARPHLAVLKALKFKVGAPESPRIHADSVLLREFQSRGALVKTVDGDPFVDDAGFAWVDLVNADGNNLWREKHRAVSEAGIDFVHAQGYPKFPRGSYAARHETGGRLHRLLTLAERTTLADWVRAGKGEGYVFTHNDTLLGQRSAFSWASEQGLTYAEMQTQIAQLQALGAMGIGARGVNVALPLDNSAQAHTQFLRNLAAAVFTPAFSLTGIERLEATLQNEQTAKQLDSWMNFRYRFIPYILGAFEEAARTGLPIVRGMALSHPNDKTAHGYAEQFMCGPALLIAPILNDSGKVTVYFPKGDHWYDLSTGVRYLGGERYEFTFGTDKTAAFGREGHMLPLGFCTPTTTDFNTARLLDEVWMFGMPVVNPCVMRNKIRVMQMQGSSYVKGLEGLKILNSDGLEVKRRGAEVRISRAR